MDQKGYIKNNGEDKSPTNNRQKRSQTLYVINFTSIRLTLFFVCCLAITAFIFSVGFYLGTSRKNTAVAVNDASASILLREDATTMKSISVPNGADALVEKIETKPNDAQILDMTTLSQMGSASNENIVVFNNKDYNEYTKALSEELALINDSVNAINKNDTPNTTYSPEKYYVVPDAKPPVAFKADNNNVTKVPYGSTSTYKDVIYFIQVAVAYNKDNSYSSLDTLKKNYPKAFIQEDQTKSGTTMYKLKIGRYNTKEEAETALQRLKQVKAYKDSYIYSAKK